jgi:hypothetical protein
MTLLERLYPHITPGTATTARERTRLLMRLYRVGPISPWVLLALRAQLRPGATLGGTR